MKTVHLTLNPLEKKSHINREIYGNFSEHLGRCVYDGIYVGKNSDIPNINGYRKDVVDAFRQIKLPVLRWPGGCFADEYHWRDGIGEMSERKKMINTNWGGVVEDNSFGTHEFMDFCELVGCEPYISGNVGSGTVEELANWVEYMTFDGVSPMAELRKRNGREQPWKLKYLGIGNESWGCGGSMRPEYYSDLYRRYATYCRNYSGNDLYKIASGANADDYNWTDVLMKQVTPWNMKGMSLHYYTVPTGDWGHKGSATDFDGQEYYKTIRSTLKMEELVTRHSAIMERYDPEHRVGLIVDEWGTWYDVEPGTNPGFLYQQNTMRDALVAAINLNIFNNHCDTVCMANIAQMVNVLQAMILTEGSRMVLTPTYHVFALYAAHQGAQQLERYAETSILNHDEQAVPTLHVSASRAADGKILVTVANLDSARAAEAKVMLGGVKASGVTGTVLTGPAAAHNTFAAPDTVTPQPLQATLTADGFTATLPACSVAAFTVTPQ